MAKAKDKSVSGSKSHPRRDVNPTVQSSSPDEASSTTRARINRILSDEDETKVAEWIDRWLDHGFPLENQKQVSAFARYFMHIANHPNKDVGVSDDFYENLFRRNRNVKHRVHAARKAYNSAKLKNEGREAKEERLARFPAFLRDLQWVLDVPSKNLYAFGDTGFVTAISSEHQGLCIEASTRDDADYRRMTSAIVCASHDNRFLSPYLISKTSVVNQQRMWYKNVSTSFAAKPWANAEFFMDWIDCVFEEETKTARMKGLDSPARLLLVDGIRYGITPKIFMSCWNKGIYLACIPHKGSIFFNPLECGVFSKMHKVYVEEAATKYREEKIPFIVDPRDVTDFILRQLDRTLLKVQLGKAWTKSHLYSRDEVALRKYVKGIPATPAPVTPAKARTRSATRQHVVQDQLMSPPRSSRQPEDTRHARGSTRDSATTSESCNETPERQQPLKSRNQPPSGLPRDCGNAVSSPSPLSPSRAHRCSRLPNTIEISDDESFDNATSTVPSNDEDSDEEASASEGVAPVLRGTPPSRSRPSPVSSFYGMSGALLQPPDRHQYHTQLAAPSVQIFNCRAPLRANLEDSRCRYNHSADSDEMTDHTDSIWTGAGLERAYRMQIRALSDPQTPESQRRTYEQKLLALAPILSGFAPGIVNALQALAKSSSAKPKGQSTSSRPLTPQTSKKTKVRKERRDRRRRHPGTERVPRQTTNHKFL
ncbi:uncharacterized protein N7458_009015 [Penicillium daleae]|uniref:DDE-1 domain-containing protein n=1 Tax=Penicillium daleae TaxID=63821 RepID=A0AAD6BWL3_9EURO|nr:uncharacterized protein N7458_009015 [Penicillium daleae]KAJ5438017.1 hypothetical protein N7458_009015 [Penicillium daleae]